MEPRILLGKVGGRGLNALFELAGERLQLLVQALVLGLLGEIMEHRHDGERLTAAIENFAGHDLHRQLNTSLGNVQLHLLASGESGADRKIGDERRKLGVVRLNHRRPLPALAVVGLE